MTRTDWVYLAGLVDGEGCLVVYMKPSGALDLRLTVAMTHEPTIAWLHRTFGGSMQMAGVSNPAWKQKFVWNVSKASAVEVVQKIRPYLKTKREQARVFLAASRLMSKAYAGKVGIPESNLIRRVRVVELMHDLNRRGVA